MRLYFNGDLSINDALVLLQYGIESKAIMEFGSGGSTQIFAQTKADWIVSIETETEWILKTQRNLDKIPDAKNVMFRPFDFIYTDKKEYDLVFVDGVWSLRDQFCNVMWDKLKPNGVMIFHDTRRDFDARMALEFAAQKYEEIRDIRVNDIDSNCTVIRKRLRLVYENWNEVEGKPKWAYSIGDNPDGEVWSMEL